MFLESAPQATSQKRPRAVDDVPTGTHGETAPAFDESDAIFSSKAVSTGASAKSPSPLRRLHRPAKVRVQARQTVAAANLGAESVRAVSALLAPSHPENDPLRSRPAPRRVAGCGV